MTLTVQEVEEATGYSAETWKGNCYGMATAILSRGLVEGRAEYGIWHGAIAPGSYFEGRPVARHGWIRLPDGQVLDPTRWVFENVDPYIYVGPDDNYDLGGADLTKQILGDVYATEPEILDFLEDPEYFIDERRFISKLAHTPPKEHPFFMAEVYEEIDKLGMSALIPIDYQEWAGM